MRIVTHQVGAMNVLLLPLIFSIVFFLGTAGFAVWAFSERQDYKYNSDQKAAEAAEIASKKTASEKDNEFVEREKEPLVEYKGPADLGGISFKYPKTWSGYVTAEEEGEFIFHPNVVTGGDTTTKVYALRVNVVSSAYADVLNEFDAQVQEGRAKAKAFTLPKMKDQVGLRIDGELEEGKQGSMIILPLRDKTIKLSTESQDFRGDFDKYIVPSFIYNP